MTGDAQYVTTLAGLTILHTCFIYMYINISNVVILKLPLQIRQSEIFVSRRKWNCAYV